MSRFIDPAWLVEIEVVLEISVAGALLHGAQGAHATVGFVGTPLIQLDFTGRFLGTGKQAAQHH